MSAINIPAQSRPPAALPPAAEAYLAVIESLGRYYDALYYGDIERLRRAFHPAATYATASSGELLQLDLDAYLPVVAARASPASQGDPYGFALEAIEFAGPTTALARMRSSMLDKRFVDVLSLLNVDGEWRIAAKVFHYEASAVTGEP